MKRSGRTIVVVTLGVLLYTLVMAWYDGTRPTAVEIRELPLESVAPVFQDVLRDPVQSGYAGDVFLVAPTQSMLQGGSFWLEAVHPDPLVHFQIQKKLQTSFPEQEFQVIRYRSLKQLLDGVLKEDKKQNPPNPLVLLEGERYWFDMKLLGSLILAGLFLLMVVRLNASSHSRA